MKMKKCLLSIVCTLLMVGGISCQSKTAKAETVEEEVECFAKVKAFATARELSDYASENGIADITACSDALSPEASQSFLVIPGKDEIKLYIHRAQKDEYGNVMPVDEGMLGQGETGKPISFVSNFEGNNCPVVVEAVDGVGRRVYWSPAFDADGNLVTDSDFIPLGKLQSAPVATTPQIQESNLKDKVELPQIGVEVVLVDGKVAIDLKDANKFIEHYASLHYFTPLEGGGRYFLQKMSGKCKGIFVGDIGQDFNPVLCMLMENGGVEIVDICQTLVFNELWTSGLLEGFDNIVDFYAGGGGEYEADGQILFSYNTIYAVDKDGEKHEIRYYPVCLPEYYMDYSNDIMRLSPDGKITIKVQPEGAPCYQYNGRFTMKEIGNDYELFDVKYEMFEKYFIENPDQGMEKVSVLGGFQLNTTDYNCLYISPNNGLSFGAPYGERVDFKRIQTEGEE